MLYNTRVSATVRNLPAPHPRSEENMKSYFTRFGVILGAAVVLVVALGAGVYVAAQDQNNSGRWRPFFGRGPGGPGGLLGRGGPGGPMGGLLGPIALGALDLTDAQEAQVRSLAETHRAATSTLVERAATAQQALNAAVMSNTLDEAAIRARSAELAAVEADLTVARARLHADIVKILTPEQRTRLEEMRQRASERMRDRRERRQQAPPAAGAA
jgi:Spy/CpxP family protein refolding chaperone